MPRPRCVLVFLASVLTAPPVSHALITITAPAAGQRLATGPDYATDVLGDPWDMSNRDDYSRYEPGENSGFSSLGLDAQGRLVGTIANSDASIGLLYRGFHGAVNPGRSGRRFPIDPATYSKLAFKLASTVAGQEPQVYWYHHPHSHPTGALTFGAQILSGDTSVVGSKVYVVDLPGANIGLAGEEWTVSPVLGLRIDPNNTPGSVGQQMGLDWVRLVPGDSHPASPVTTVQWIGSPGSYTITVTELGPNAAQPFTIVSGFGGFSYAWRYGTFPPGDYRLTVTRLGGGGDTATVDVTINAPPILHLTDPDETGGEDFATVVRGNAWDMSDAADVVQVTQMTDGGTFASGEFTATSVTGEVGRDSQVWLLMTDTAPTPVVDPVRYHRLSYRYTLDGPFDPGDGGSVARILWGGVFNHADRLADTEDIIVWAGTNSYTIDLAALAVGEDLGIEAGGTAPALWVGDPKRFLRFDPHEGASGRTFHLDDVRLAADDEPGDDGRFTVRWTWSDPDAMSAPTVTLYADDDRDPTNGKSLIAAGLSASDAQYVWNTIGLADGVHYVYAETTDGTNTTGRYATGPLRIGGNPEVCGDCLDNDGNGLIDYEDPTCCAQPVDLQTGKARFQPGKGGIGLAKGRLTIGARIPGADFTAIDPTREDVTVQFRNASGELLCATGAANRWTRRKKGFVFLDANGTAMAGIRKQTLRVKNGGVDFTTFGRLIDVTRFFDASLSRNDLSLTLRVGGRCAVGSVGLQAKPNGRFGYP